MYTIVLALPIFLEICAAGARFATHTPPPRALLQPVAGCLDFGRRPVQWLLCAIAPRPGDGRAVSAPRREKSAQDCARVRAILRAPRIVSRGSENAGRVAARTTAAWLRSVCLRWSGSLANVLHVIFFLLLLLFLFASCALQGLCSQGSVSLCSFSLCPSSWAVVCRFGLLSTLAPVLLPAGPRVKKRREIDLAVPVRSVAVRLWFSC
jgi:hypothetical protein